MHPRDIIALGWGRMDPPSDELGVWLVMMIDACCTAEEMHNDPLHVVRKARVRAALDRSAVAFNTSSREPEGDL